MFDFKVFTKEEICANKELVQVEALTAWHQCGYLGTILAVTGCGKTRMGVLAAGRFIRKDPSQRWLVLTPRINLRDREWPDEFRKWGFEAEMQNVDIETIQTACKWEKGREYAGVIVDEAHLFLTDKRLAFFRKHYFHRTLCLTATIEGKNKQKRIKEFAPPCYYLPIVRAKDLGLVSNHVIVNIPVNFTEDERDTYSKYNKMFNKASSFFRGSFDLAFRAMKDPESVYRYLDQSCSNRPAHQYDQFVKQTYKTAFTYNTAMRMRNECILASIEKLAVSKQILDLLKNERLITFSESQDQANQLYQGRENSSVLYHSNLPEKKRSLNLSIFAKNHVNHMISCKALDLGLNVPECTYGLVISGTKTETQSIQRVGRIIRAEPGKLAVLIQLYVKNTVDQEKTGFRYPKEFYDVIWDEGNLENLQYVINQVKRLRNERS